MGQAFSGGSNPADGQVNPPPGYTVPRFPALYKPDIIGYFSATSDGQFLYYAEDIFHYTLYWHLIFHALIFGLTGLWFTFVALLSPTSSVGVRSLSGRRTKTDFRTNTEVAEEGVFDVGMDVEGDARQGGKGRKGSASDNEAAKGGIRERARRGSGTRAIRGLGEQRDPLRYNGDDEERTEGGSGGKPKPRRTSSAEGLKIMDFAENPDDIPLIPTKSGRSGPSGSGSSSGGVHHPRPRRLHNNHDARGRTTSMLSARSEQSSDLETHPTGAFSGAQDRPVRRPPRSPSPPSMEIGMDIDDVSPDFGELELDRPISHTDAPMPNQSQYSLHREEDLSREASMQDQRSRTRLRLQPGEGTEQGPDRLGPLKSLFSATHHEHLQAHTHFDPQAVRANKRERRSRRPKHSRRPAPIWLAALPLPFFALWGLASAVIMSTIIGFTLSAVYNTAGFEMSTWVPFLWAVIEASLVMISSYSTLTSVL